MHQELRAEPNDVQLQRRGFSISNLLAPHLKAINTPDQPPDLTAAVDEEEARTEDSTGRDSSISTDQPEDDDPLFGSEGMLTSFSPLFVQQLAQNAAASLAMNSRSTDGQPANPNEQASTRPHPQSTSKTADHSPRSHPNGAQSSSGPANGSPEWFNAMNYLNMANRQLQFMSNNPAGWFLQHPLYSTSRAQEIVCAIDRVVGGGNGDSCGRRARPIGCAHFSRPPASLPGVWFDKRHAGRSWTYGSSREAIQRQKKHHSIDSNTQNSFLFAGWDPRLAWLQPYLPKAQQKRKGGQIRFTNEQTDALEHMFDNNKYLSNVQRRKLAKSLSLSERQVSGPF